MEALVGFIFLVALWLTFLTHKTRQQTLENKKLENQNKYYIKQLQEINALINQKDDGKEKIKIKITKATEAGKTGRRTTGETGG